MKENIKALIEELKGVVMDLHRSAGSLDKIVQDLEREIDDMYSQEKYLMMYINAQRHYRKDLKKAAFGNIEQKEDDVWNRMEEAISEGES